MDSTPSPAQAHTHQDSGEVLVPAPKDQKAAEEALSRLLREATAIASDRRTDSDALPVAEPSLDATLRPADLKDVRFLSDTPSPGRRASPALTRFLIVAFIGVACTLAWQSYGEAAKRKLASWAPPVGWVILLPALKPPPGAGFVAERPSPPAVQESAPDSPHAASPAQTAPNIAALTAPAAPSPDVQQQLEAMARDLAALRQSVDQLAVGQEQMGRDIANLQAAEKDIGHRTSAPPPKPAAAPARKPVPKPPPQAAPQISAAPPPPPMPPPVRPAPEISAAPPPPALPPTPPQPPPEISAGPPGLPAPLRPPMPVPN